MCNRANGVVFCCRGSSQASSILTSQLKPANGLVTGAGLELITPPLTAAQLSTQDIGLFVNQHVGYAQPVTATATGQNLQIVKREPEDLSHHRRLDTTSPDLESGGTIIGTRQRPKVIDWNVLSSFIVFFSSLIICAQCLVLIIYWSPKRLFISSRFRCFIIMV